MIGTVEMADEIIAKIQYSLSPLCITSLSTPVLML